ncbi:hypothetical protein GCM10011534_30190 [Pseudooceanicola nanhaiensis]|uniref:Uncharacterized protein n=1 Tax=Pseudooceanicola nanhaiensis TaxID=375761 RepID=A0A917T1S1_9RHOB|nr:hypothetical protein GCM10011534_30190 [Pseudooceanicola nanhaiensis]
MSLESHEEFARAARVQVSYRHTPNPSRVWTLVATDCPVWIPDLQAAIRLPCGNRDGGGQFH